MAKNFTFKKKPRETGLAAVGNPVPSTVIKFDKKQVGYIVAPSWTTEDRLWRVRLMVKDTTLETCWKWVALKAKFESEPLAREYLKANFQKLFQLNLHQLD